MRTGRRDHQVDIDESVMPNALNFPDVFNVAVAFIDRHVENGRGQCVAVRHPQGEVTYAQLAENVGRAGNALLDVGLKPGDRLVMAAVDEPMFLYVFWGAIKAGIIPVAVSTFLREPEYRFLVADSQCAGFVYSSVVGGEAAGVKGATPQLRMVLPLEGTDSFAGWMASASPRLDPAPTSPSTDCFWLYSSGSTGNPKGVVHVHRDMVVTSERYGRRVAGLLPDDVVFCASKLFFSFGFGGGMTFPFWVCLK